MVDFEVGTSKLTWIFVLYKNFNFIHEFMVCTYTRFVTELKSVIFVKKLD